METIKYAKFVDPDNSIFEILDLVAIKLPPRIWWHSEDFETPSYYGHLFRGVFEKDTSIERAYILVADVTDDSDEPDTSIITDDNIKSIDEKIQKILEKELPKMGMSVVRWMNSQLNFIFDRNVLVTAYIVDDPGVGHRQRICSRMKVNDRKVAIEVCFNIADADTLARPMFLAMHPVRFV